MERFNPSKCSFNYVHPLLPGNSLIRPYPFYPSYPCTFSNRVGDNA
jgi:hypothetical protein